MRVGSGSACPWEANDVRNRGKTKSVSTSVRITTAPMSESGAIVAPTICPRDSCCQSRNRTRSRSTTSSLPVRSAADTSSTYSCENALGYAPSASASDDPPLTLSASPRATIRTRLVSAPSAMSSSVCSSGRPAS